MPRVFREDASNVELPRPLTPEDVAVTRRVFKLQAQGNIAEAIRISAGLHDPLLTGAILADRYLSRNHRATPTELSDWLSNFRDQADARAIRALLLTKLPKGTPLQTSPDVVAWSRPPMPTASLDSAAATRSDLPQQALDRPVIDQAEQGDAPQALRRIASARAIARGSAARRRAEVAQSFFTHNDDTSALRIVEELIRDTPLEDQNSLTYYIGGLAAWRADRFEQARRLFESGAQAAISSPRLRAASAFWASRANRRLHNSVSMVKWLRQAAAERATLHGILARRILRMDIVLVPGGELLTEPDVDAVEETSEGQRAFALLQVGQPARATAELRALWPRIQTDPGFGRSVLLVAATAGLNDLATQLASLLHLADGRHFDEAGFPIPRLRPSGGFRVDPALVYALTRMESNFNSGATSRAGATGLMQIMPATANYVAAGLTDAGDRLHDPAFNLEVGQRYVTYLARQDGIDSDLIRLLAGYNVGPGNILHWIGDIRDDDDPLLFMEAIPVRETRNFVADVLAASWIYAAKLHRPAPSLDSLAAGEFPRFTPLTRESKLVDVALRLD